MKLYLLNGKEILCINGNALPISRLQIANEFIKCLKDKNNDEIVDAVFDFHRKFYNAEKTPMYFSQWLKNEGYIESFSPLDYVIPETILPDSKHKNLILEAQALNYVIALLLRYRGKYTQNPFDRFSRVNTVLQRYDWGKLIKLTRDTIIDMLYFYDDRINYFHSRLSSYEGKPCREITSNDLIPLAWAELEYYIENNILFKQCFVCEIWFPINKRKNKRLMDTGYKHIHDKVCSSKKCHEEYLRFYGRVRKKFERTDCSTIQWRKLNDFMKKYFTKGKQVGRDKIETAKKEYKAILHPNS